MVIGGLSQQLNCNTNNTRNVHVFNGTLVITAISQKHLNKDYTSGKIITKQGFTYGRFEIRAALPKGKMLRPEILMIPVISSPDWARNGLIEIMTNNQSKNLGSGFHRDVPPVHSSQEFTTSANLNEFHTYSIEWNKLAIRWFFDDINHFTLSIDDISGTIYTKSGQPFDQPFRLVIQLGVGSFFFKDQILTEEDVKHWESPRLIVDYVRIYSGINQNGINQNEKPFLMDSNTLLLVILPIIIIILISIIVFLFVRNKKLNRIQTDKHLENYDDIIGVEIYDTYNKDNLYEEPYEDTSQYYAAYHYKDEGFDNLDQIDNEISSPLYLDMTVRI